MNEHVTLNEKDLKIATFLHRFGENLSGDEVIDQIKKWNVCVSVEQSQKTNVRS